eukprot:g429.t1
MLQQTLIFDRGSAQSLRMTFLGRGATSFTLTNVDAAYKEFMPQGHWMRGQWATVVQAAAETMKTPSGHTFESGHVGRYANDRELPTEQKALRAVIEPLPKTVVRRPDACAAAVATADDDEPDIPAMPDGGDDVDEAEDEEDEDEEDEEGGAGYGSDASVTTHAGGGVKRALTLRSKDSLNDGVPERELPSEVLLGVKFRRAVGMRQRLEDADTAMQEAKSKDDFTAAARFLQKKVALDAGYKRRVVEVATYFRSWYNAKRCSPTVCASQQDASAGNPFFYPIGQSDVTCVFAEWADDWHGDGALKDLETEVLRQEGATAAAGAIAHGDAALKDLNPGVLRQEVAATTAAAVPPAPAPAPAATTAATAAAADHDPDIPAMPDGGDDVVGEAEGEEGGAGAGAGATSKTTVNKTKKPKTAKQVTRNRDGQAGKKKRKSKGKGKAAAKKPKVD